MKVDIKNLEKSQKEISVELLTEDIQKYYEKAIEKISPNLKIKGFRPGKIPADLVKKTVGEHAIFEEAAEEAVRHTFIEIIDTNKIKAIGQPNIQITKLALGSPVEYKAIISVLPEISLGKYVGLNSFKKDEKVTEQEISDVLKRLQNSKIKFVDKEEEAKNEDRINIDFSASIDGKNIENGDVKNQLIILGDGKFLHNFEQKIIGMKKGEQKEFKVKMPKDYHKEDLRDKELDFKVKVNSVQKGVVPELNDEFAKSLGYNVNTVEDLKKDIEKHLSKQKENSEKEKEKVFLINQVVEKSKMEIPQILIDSELDRMVEEYKMEIERMKIDFAEYLAKNGKKEEDIKKELVKEAENRIKINLVLREIAEKENIQIDKKDIDEELDSLAKIYPDIKKGNREDTVYYIDNSLKNKRVFEFLEKNAK